MPTTSTTPTNLHIHFLLDRSGSMASSASDVIGGFNQFLKGQKMNGSDAVMTLVQFDSQDPQEVLVDALPIRKVRRLNSSTFAPRGSTPLFDALGQMLANASSRVKTLATEGLPPEEQLVVLFTDGEENASVEFSLKAIAKLIKTKEALGWGFLYLGANQDAFQSGGDLGISRGNISNFSADSVGSALAFQDLDANISAHRASLRNGRESKISALLNQRLAEEDFQTRK